MGSEENAGPVRVCGVREEERKMATKKNKKEVYDAMGRGTPAGRALFAIYNGDRCETGTRIHAMSPFARADRRQENRGGAKAERNIIYGFHYGFQ